MSERRRGATARLGITLLNLLVPGLGLLRVGDKRRALIVCGIAVGSLLILIAAFGSMSNISFATYAVLVSLTLTLTLAALVLAMWWTWRESAVLTEPDPFGRDGIRLSARCYWLLRSAGR